MIARADPRGDAPALSCPGCGAAMRALELARKPHGEAVVDLCPACRGLWFDTHESVQLTPDATLALLRAAADLGERAAPSRPGPLGCPRCRRGLVATQDVQRSTRFTYWRCPQGHGRFTPFVQFMREKDYVRPLTPAELSHLRAQVGTVRCTGCGASVDLGRDSACAYCGARVETLDPAAIRRVLDAASAAPPPAITAHVQAAMDALTAAQRARPRPGFEPGADLVFPALAYLLDGDGA